MLATHLRASVRKSLHLDVNEKQRQCHVNRSHFSADSDVLLKPHYNQCAYEKIDNQHILVIVNSTKRNMLNIDRNAVFIFY